MRYFVVIDDMLEEDLWDNLQSAFPDTAGSRIVVTTSIQSIAT
ncbi:NB-ARC domain-containing protein, partial [Escherichia coli]